MDVPNQGSFAMFRNDLSDCPKNFALAQRTYTPLLIDGLKSLGRRVVSSNLRPSRRDPVSFINGGRVPDSEEAEKIRAIAPGVLIDSAPIEVLGTLNRRSGARCFRYSYVTRDSCERLIEATAVVCFSELPWQNGPRPVVAVAPSTQGVAAHCDPSHSCVSGFNLYMGRPFDAIAAYELPIVIQLLSFGVDVVFIDYPRDPILGIQYYSDSISAAKALFDALIAAQSLGLSPDAPLGMWGFSQGGSAVGWCTQMQDYAPNLNPLAAVIGAPPSKLIDVLNAVDGGLLMGMIAYAAAGLSVIRPEICDEVTSVLNPQGIKEIMTNIGTCAVGTLFNSRYHRSSAWTKTGRPLGALLTTMPNVSQELKRQVLGERPPEFPVLLWGSRNDDVVPIAQIRAVRDAWVCQGGDITWHENDYPRVPGHTGLNHFGPYFLNMSRYSRWLVDRLS